MVVNKVVVTAVNCIKVIDPVTMGDDNVKEFVVWSPLDQ
jgi:hypothetical protein